MDRKLTCDDVKAEPEGLRASIEKEERWSYDCMEGFLVQLELDSDGDVVELFSGLRSLLGDDWRQQQCAVVLSDPKHVSQEVE